MVELNYELDPIMLGFGHGFISVGEELLLNVRKMKVELVESTGCFIPRIHIVDHDLDSSKNIVWLEENEYIIRIYGKEILREKMQKIEGNWIIDKLRDIIIEYISVFQDQSISK